jgi:hypothetical protein
MLDTNSSRIRVSRPVGLSSTVSAVKEGALLAAILEGGVEVAKPSTGAVGETIIGLALSQFMDATTVSAVEDVVVPSVAPYTVTLRATPITPATKSSARETSTPLAMTYNAAAGAAQFGIVGNVVTFNAAQAGKNVSIAYTYAPSIVQAQALFGQGIGDAAQSVINGTTVIKEADVVFTDQFDTSDDWFAGATTALYSGAGGVITLKTAGTLIANARLVAAPSSAVPMIGVYLNL